MTPDGGKRLPRPGRPTKLEVDRTQKVLRALQGGSALDTAAAFAGVHRDTLHEWLRRGEAEEAGPYREFSDAVRSTLASAEVAASASVSLAMKKNWQAAAWYLERRNPRIWGPKVRVTLEQEFDAAIDRLEEALPTEWFEIALHAILGEPGTPSLAAEGGGSRRTGEGPEGGSPPPSVD